MAGYSSYSLRAVKKKFGLIEKSAPIFEGDCPTLTPPTNFDIFIHLIIFSKQFYFNILQIKIS
jgi:hypothetical protein